MSELSWEAPWSINGKLLLSLIVLALGLDILSTGIFLSQIQNFGIPFESVIQFENNPLLLYYWRTTENLGLGLLLHFIILTVGYTGILSLSKISTDSKKIQIGEKFAPFHINHGAILFIAFGVIIGHFIVSVNNFVFYKYYSSILSGVGPLVLRVLAAGGLLPLVISQWKGQELVKIDF